MSILLDCQIFSHNDGDFDRVCDIPWVWIVVMQRGNSDQFWQISWEVFNNNVLISTFLFQPLTAILKVCKKKKKVFLLLTKSAAGPSAVVTKQKLFYDTIQRLQKPYGKDIKYDIFPHCLVTHGISEQYLITGTNIDLLTCECLLNVAC